MCKCAWVGCVEAEGVPTHTYTQSECKTGEKGASPRGNKPVGRRRKVNERTNERASEMRRPRYHHRVSTHLRIAGQNDWQPVWKQLSLQYGRQIRWIAVQFAVRINETRTHARQLYAYICKPPTHTHT